MIRLVKTYLQDNSTDFRFIPFGIVILYIISLILSELFLGSYAVLGKIYKIQPIPYFADLEILLCGVDAIREGVDPYQTFCSDREIYFNYPYLWGILSFIPFINSSNLIYIGFVLSATFFVSLYVFVGKINFKSALIYSLIFVSPATMLGVERGNCDLIIFLLLIIIPLIAYKSKVLSSIFILVASMLKIFPIAAIIYVFHSKLNSIKKSVLLAFGVVSVFLIYVFIMLDNMIMVSEKTPRPFKAASYGLGGFPAFVNNYLKIESDNTIYMFLGFTFCCLLLFLLFFRIFRKFPVQPSIDDNKNGVAFLIGSGIFLITCIIGFNWEYRLVFLILTIPQILEWRKDKRRFKIMLLLLYFLLFWCSLIKPVLSLALPYSFENLFSYFITTLLFFTHLYIVINNFGKILGTRLKLNSTYK